MSHGYAKLFSSRYPKFLGVIPVNDKEKMFVDQKLFWSGNGMLLYLLQHLSWMLQMQLGNHPK